jgi:hypothetical protein
MPIDQTVVVLLAQVPTPIACCFVLVGRAVARLVQVLLIPAALVELSML